MKKNLLVAAAIGGLMTAGATLATASAHAGNAKGECHGVNSCKGTGACGGKGHSCAGKNSCKGKGWLKIDKKSCEAKILNKAKEQGMFYKKG